MTGFSKFVDIPEEVILATVIEVAEGKGVKIQIEGDEAPIETYFNSLIIPNVGDRVQFKRTGDTLIIQGSLKF